MYSCQTPRCKDASAADASFSLGPWSGFEGGTYSGRSSASDLVPCSPSLPMTFAALALLTTTGDDLQRVDMQGTLGFLLQAGPGSARPGHEWDGSFCGCLASPLERDLRMVFSAVATFHLLGSWTKLPIRPIVRYILSCQSWDGAFGLSPSREGHGGSTHCAVASLFLVGALASSPLPAPRVAGGGSGPSDQLSEEDRKRVAAAVKRAEDWLMQRYLPVSEGCLGGVSGRAGKPADVCYSWWITAALVLLGRRSWLDGPDSSLVSYVKLCQDPMAGGIGKNHECSPDPLHSYYALAGLALVEFPGMGQVDAALHMPAAAAEAAGVHWTPKEV